MKTLLVDDHELFRCGLSMLLGERFPEAVLREAVDLEAAQACLQAEPDIELVLLGWNPQDGGEVEAVGQLKALLPQRFIVVVSGDQRPGTIVSCIHEGAAGFICKTSSPEVVTHALQVVLGGGLYLPSPADPVRGPDDDDEADHAVARRVIADLDLSPRQVDVLRLLAQGSTNKVIGRELDLAESTVKTHVLGLFRKLQVATRTEAVLAAAKLGLRFGRDEAA